MGVDAKMFVRVRPALTQARVNRLSYELASAFGAERFNIHKESNERALTIVSKFEQDGLTLKPKSGEQFIDVSLYTRYYGEGYERGDLPFIVTVAGWLEHRFRSEPGNTQADVWYGGDNAKLFDSKARADLFRYFAREAHHPYRQAFNNTSGLSRQCSFCDAPMRQYMWSGDNGAVCCDGCNTYEVTKDQGRTWTPDEETRCNGQPKVNPDTGRGFVLSCLEHEDCRATPELGVACHREQEAKRAERMLDRSSIRIPT